MKYAFLFAAALVIVPATANAQQGQATVVIQQPAPPPPVYVQPAPVYPAPPAYGPPVYSQPTYIQPTYAMPRRRTVVPYNGGPIPPGGTIHTRRMLGLAIPMTVVFGATYLVNVFVALAAGSCSSCGYNEAVNWLYAPVIGPWIMLTQNVGAHDAPILVLDGIIEGASFLAMVAGYLVNHQDLVYYANGAPQHHPSRRPMWSLVPAAPGAQLGLSFGLTNF